MNYNKNKLNISGILIILAVLLALVLSLSLYLFSNLGVRRTFIFEPVNGGELIFEVRHLPTNSPQGNLKLYVDELLLGSITPSCKMLFPVGTKAKACFTKGNILYLNLSNEALQIKSDNEISDFAVATEILQKNIFTNFKNINIIKLYVGENEVYADNKLVN